MRGAPQEGPFTCGGGLGEVAREPPPPSLHPPSVWRMGGRAGLDSGSVGMLASGSEGRGRSCDDGR